MRWTQFCLLSVYYYLKQHQFVLLYWYNLLPLSLAISKYIVFSYCRLILLELEHMYCLCHHVHCQYRFHMWKLYVIKLYGRYEHVPSSLLDEYSYVLITNYYILRQKNCFVLTRGGRSKIVKMMINWCFFFLTYQLLNDNDIHIEFRT